MFYALFPPDLIYFFTAKLQTAITTAVPAARRRWSASSFAAKRKNRNGSGFREPEVNPTTSKGRGQMAV
jgi:hypothetical protein